MPSQEEYLDQLLKDMMNGESDSREESVPAPEESVPAAEELAPEEPIADIPEPAPKEDPWPEPFHYDAEDDAPGEADIERMLAETRAAAARPDETETIPDNQDLMELLSNTGDENMDALHDLLQKEEDNVAVDNSIFESDNADAELAALLEEPAEALSPREQKKLARQKAREEKAAARAEAKARKKAEAAARKAAKAEKKAAKAEKPVAPKSGEAGEAMDLPEKPGSETPEAAVEKQRTEIPSGPVEVDMSDMDALLGLGDMIPEVEHTEPASTDAEEPLAAEPDIGMDLDAPEETPLAPREDAEQAMGADAALGELAEKEPEKKPKKGFLAKILELLTEETPDPEEEAKGTEDIPLSDENREILEELDQEDKAKGKKGGKGKDKKEKKKKEKKPKEKKPKAEKPKKPKKEKKLKEDAPEKPVRKIPFKRILPLVVLGITLFAGIFVIIHFGSDAVVKKQAAQAFYDEDYETCYQELYGKDLNESEQVMYAKSESILRINLWMREYEMFVEFGSETEALDVLIQAVEDYPALETYAQEWNAYSEVRSVYEQMLAILSEKYHLTEEAAQAIAEEPDDEEYTRKVTAIVSGQETVSGNEPVYETEQLPDMLPEEQNFQENQIEVK